MKEYSLRNFTYIFVLIVLLNVSFFLVTGVLHELGHALYGVVKGCENIQIVIFNFVTHSAYTAMECPGTFSQQLHGLLIFMSSFILVLPISLSFLLLRDFKERYIGLIILGANLIASAFDIMAFYESDLLKYGIMFLGGLLIVLGEDRMISATIKKRTPELPEEKKDSEDPKLNNEENNNKQ